MDKLVDAKSKAIIFTLVKSMEKYLDDPNMMDQRLMDIISENANMANSIYESESYRN